MFDSNIPMLVSASRLMKPWPKDSRALSLGWSVIYLGWHFPVKEVAVLFGYLDTTWYYPLEASSKASTTKYGIPSFADRQSSRHDVSWRDVTVTWQNVSSYSKVAVPSKSQKLHWSRPRAQKKSGPKSWQVMARSRNRRFLGQYCDTPW